MIDGVGTSPTGQQVGQLLATSLSEAPEGVELSYRVLEHVAARHQVERAWLVLRPALLGPQIFARGRQAAAPAAATELLSRPSGLYTEPDTVDLGVRTALAGACNLVLSSQAARQSAAIDAISGLASRPMAEAALVRAAAQGARHGWPFTVLLLAMDGDGEADGRWRSFCRSLRSALRSGDEAGVAGPGRVIVILGNADSDAVRPFVRRLRAALDSGGAGDIEFRVSAARSPDETLDPDELWRLLDERLPDPETRSELGEPSPVVIPGPLELELRSLPGIVSVGLSMEPTPVAGAGPRLTVVAVEPADTLRLAVLRVLGNRLSGATLNLMAATAPARPYAEGQNVAEAPPVAQPAPPVAQPAPPAIPASTRISEYGPGTPAGEPAVLVGSRPMNGTPGAHPTDLRPSPLPTELRNGNGQNGHPPTAGGRVTLLTVRFDADTGTSQVDLALGTARGSGRATVGQLAGGAQATLAALEALGLDVPYYLVSAERAVGITGEPVVVVLAPRRPSDGRPVALGRSLLPRIGVADGAEAVEAASRATLSALNRFLSGGKKAPAG